MTKRELTSAANEIPWDKDKEKLKIKTRSTQIEGWLIKVRKKETRTLSWPKANHLII